MAESLAELGLCLWGLGSPHVAPGLLLQPLSWTHPMFAPFSSSGSSFRPGPSWKPQWPPSRMGPRCPGTLMAACGDSGSLTSSHWRWVPPAPVPAGRLPTRGPRSRAPQGCHA